MKRGELWWAVLDPVVGHEQAGRRPVVVVSANWWNQAGGPVVGIVPISSKVKGLPHHIAIPEGMGGLPRASVLVPEHLRYVDRRRLVDPVGGELSSEIMAKLRDLIFKMM